MKTVSASNVPLIRLADEPDSVASAVAALENGELVVLPTETVYGLAADAANGEAVAAIFAAKGRPRFNPLIAHVDGIAMAERLCRFDPLSRDLAAAFWPGPLTLVLTKRDDAPVHDLVTAGQPTLAIRHPLGFASRIIAELGRPLAAPSANRSGRISGTDAQAVANDLGGSVAMIVDGGAPPVGVESTIAKVEDGIITVLRPGGVTAEELTNFGEVRRAGHGAAIEAPGMMTSHYAPNTTLRLDVEKVREGEALLAFGPDRVGGFERAVAVENLSESGDLRQAAARLFAAMRALDGCGAAGIAVEPIPTEGLGEAIRDRLIRAAAPRSESDKR
ncbi:L-threonylcarbamoyladenylate synthase [Notoacmeibacter sp. MSK16QG-6]|uniref:L-threonylcarbamoyladenylate synthase n=1 Tax=Notoacmeibacter sp. MSK16QG-6 TaxID=2957982 RepID=UPI00209F8313|nr:L-threonylcarbamoyladenylate synthase [Notoacmeibacter sp. MSK16QG-6]MCP1198249.1 L-threonylcarbamoyladenylate synthase [Notoacmeibacter sp. MSK16QG-6]